MKDITIKLSLIFRKEFKKLAKKYRSLPFDLERLIESIQENPIQGTDLGNKFRKIRLAITSWISQNAFYLEKHRAPRIRKPLHLSHNGKRLARKSSQQQVVRRNVFFRNLRDVSLRMFPEVCRIRYTGCLIPLRREHTLIAQLIKRNTDAPYASKQIYESYHVDNCILG